MPEPIIITGCQRSGTTLLNLIFDSHPEIISKEEAIFHGHFTIEKYLRALNRERDCRWLSLKLPMQSHQLLEISEASDAPARVAWLLRDPRAVVASMIHLHLKINAFVSVSWAASFVHKEIINVLQTLPNDWLVQLEEQIHRFRLVENVPSILRPAEDIYFTAALCWRLKYLTLQWYQKQGLPCRVVIYERLVQAPEPELRALLDDFGVPWDSAVLDHPGHARVVAIGGTRRDQAITDASVEKWRAELDACALDTIKAICGPAAAECGYDFG